MKARDRTSLLRRLLEADSSLALLKRDRFIGLTPINRILRSVFLEDSSDRDGVYAWIFIQPLYVPFPAIAFSIGDRLGGPSRTFGAHEGNALVEAFENARTLWRGIVGPGSLADSPLVTAHMDYAVVQVRAYSLVAAERFDEAAPWLRKVIDILDDDDGWQGKARADAQALLSDSPARALQRLTEWELQTRTAIGLGADRP